MPRAAPGTRFGGRTKGIPNKSTKELIDRIKEKYEGYCPVEAMCEIALDPTSEPSIKLMANKEVAQYLYPKRKAIQHSLDEGGAIPVINIIESDAEAK
jgi:hypothetical protein